MELVMRDLKDDVGEGRLLPCKRWTREAWQGQIGSHTQMRRRVDVYHHSAIGCNVLVFHGLH